VHGRLSLPLGESFSRLKRQPVFSDIPAITRGAGGAERRTEDVIERQDGAQHFGIVCISSTSEKSGIDAFEVSNTACRRDLVHDSGLEVM
jgi:hypothetical protein